MDKFESKMLEEIKKTGFPTELMVGQILLKQEWYVEQSKYFFDLDENRGRELDVLAFRRLLFKEPIKYDVGLHLVIEVKKSEKRPWIIFTSKKGYTESMFNSVPLNYSSDFEWKKTFPYGVAYYDACENIGRTYCEAFKSYDEKSVIFSALTTVYKARKDCFKKNSDAIQALKVRDKTVSFVESIVVVEGLLYEAFLDEKSNIGMRKIDYIPVDFGYLSNNYTSEHNPTYIVTLNYFEALLNDISKWHDNVAIEIGKGHTE